MEGLLAPYTCKFCLYFLCSLLLKLSLCCYFRMFLPGPRTISPGIQFFTGRLLQENLPSALKNIFLKISEMYLGTIWKSHSLSAGAFTKRFTVSFVFILYWVNLYTLLWFYLYYCYSNFRQYCLLYNNLDLYSIKNLIFKIDCLECMVTNMNSSK